MDGMASQKYTVRAKTEKGNDQGETKGATLNSLTYYSGIWGG